VQAVEEAHQIEIAAREILCGRLGELDPIPDGCVRRALNHLDLQTVG
jgi:hypothetical protein